MSILPFSIHVVKGHSMQPRIREGGRVVVFNWAYAFSQPKVGDVVVFSGNDDKKYVKRIKTVADKKFLVEGDNKGDSRKLPPVSRKSIAGRVVFTY